MNFFISHMLKLQHVGTEKKIDTEKKEKKKEHFPLDHNNMSRATKSWKCKWNYKETAGGTFCN